MSKEDIQDKRIRAVLGIEDEEEEDELDFDEAVARFCEHLKKNLRFPFEVTGIEDFRWEEFYILGPGDEGEYKQNLFAGRLKGFAKNVILLKGGMSDKKRRELSDQIAAIPEGEERLLLATGRYIGEGFDDARLDSLFLAMPISWRGTLQQYAGRLHRLHHNKRVVQIYDYIDAGVPMLKWMYEKRLKGYKAIGYSIQE